MPYFTAKEGTKWCVFKKSDNTKVGCTATKAELKKYLEALHSNEPNNSMNHFKYLKNFSFDKKEATLLLYNSIGTFTDDDGEVVNGVDGAEFAATLQYLEDCGVDTVNVRINSPGGSVMEGWSIVSAIKNSKMEIHTFNDGLCASIAAVIFASGDYRHAMDYSITMIHNPSGVDDSEVLNRIKESLITILENGSIYDKDELETLMDKETYFNAEEAKNAGLCDDIIDSGEKVDTTITSDLTEMVNVFNQVINKLDMKKSTKNKMGVESPTTLTNDDEAAKKVVPVVADKAKDEDMPDEEEGDEEQDGDAEDSKDDSATVDGNDTATEADKFKDMYNDLMDKHTKLNDDFEKMKAERDDLSTKLDTMKDEVRKEHKKKIEAMVNDLFIAGKIGKTEIDSVTKLAEKDFDSVKNLFNRVGLVKNVSFKTVINDSNVGVAGLEAGWTIRDYEKKNPSKLMDIKNNLPAVYAQMYKEYYGTEYKN